LFFLQPIVRGWARFKWAWSERIPPHSRMLSAAETIPSCRHAEHREQIISYWSAGGLDRSTLLQRIIERLQGEHWPVKLDTGYSDYDLEIVGSNWARLRVTTVSEELEQGRHVFRCRIKSNWTFRSEALFWLCVAAIMSLVGVLARVEPWLWMLPTILPVLQLFFDAQKRRLQQSITSLLDQIVTEQGLTRVNSMLKD
jgi:hypothetical protein